MVSPLELRVIAADAHVVQAGCFCRLVTAQGKGPGGHRQVRHVKLGMKAQQAVWNLRVESGFLRMDLKCCVKKPINFFKVLIRCNKFCSLFHRLGSNPDIICRDRGSLSLKLSSDS